MEYKKIDDRRPTTTGREKSRHCCCNICLAFMINLVLIALLYLAKENHLQESDEVLNKTELEIQFKHDSLKIFADPYSTTTQLSSTSTTTLSSITSTSTSKPTTTSRSTTSKPTTPRSTTSKPTTTRSSSTSRPTTLTTTRLTTSRPTTTTQRPTTSTRTTTKSTTTSTKSTTVTTTSTTTVSTTTTIPMRLKAVETSNKKTTRIVKQNITRMLMTNGSVRAMVINSEKRILVTGSSHMNIWNLDTGEMLRTVMINPYFNITPGLTCQIWALNINKEHPDEVIIGFMYVSNRTLVTWNLTSNKIVGEPFMTDSISGQLAVDVNRLGHIFVNDESDVVVFDSTSKKRLGTIVGNATWIKLLCVSDSIDRLYTVNVNLKVEVRNVSTGALIASFAHPKSELALVNSIILANRLDLLFTTGSDGLVMTWNATTGVLLYNITIDGVYTLAINENTDELFTGHFSGRVSVFKIFRDRLTKTGTIKCINTSGIVTSIAVDTLGEVLTCGNAKGFIGIVYSYSRLLKQDIIKTI